MADAEALFAAHQPGLVRYLSRAVGHAETARDLTQDVFVRVVASDVLPGSDGERRAWIFRIARNLAMGTPEGRTGVSAGVGGQVNPVAPRGDGPLIEATSGQVRLYTGRFFKDHKTQLLIRLRRLR